MKLGQWIGLLVLITSVYILWQIRQVLLLVFLAIILATALHRVQQKFCQLGLKRNTALTVTLCLTLTIIVGFFFLVVPPFVRESAQLAELVPEGLDQLQVWFNQLSQALPGSVGDVRLLDRATQQLQPLVGELFNNFFAFFSNTLAILLNLLLVLVLTVMLMVNPTPYRQGFVRLFPAFYRRRIDGILSQSEQALVGWLGGTLINMVVIGSVSGIVLLVLGVRLVLANALLAGVLEAIPNIGPVISLIPPIAIALLDSPWKAIAVLVAYVVIQQLEQYLLVPTVMAKQVDLLPAFGLLSQLIFAIFFGFLGLLLALPLVIVGRVWFYEIVIKDILDHWGAQADSQPDSNLNELPLETKQEEQEKAEGRRQTSA
ncbi:MAG: AI-2E family transporter [Aphanocapsa sp. GSE-SYN-MK-11-07L]|nr:AI-2E family transporter [Aphanocapsa sp. GSE-SYN-MK-11-07L]